MSESAPPPAREESHGHARRGRNLARPFSSIALEAFLVALGVVFALAANEWRESVAQRDTAQEALGSIRDELEFNRALLDSSLSYHSAIADSLQRILAQGGTPAPRLFRRGYIAPARVQSTAWDTARQTNALGPLSYDRILEVSRMYTMLEGYRTQTETSGRIIYEILFREGPEGIVGRPRNHAVILYTFIYRERELAQRFDEFLAKWQDQL